MKKSLLPVFLLPLAFLLSCEAPAPDCTVDEEAVQTEIQALEDAYAEASNARDADSQVAYYADDAVSLPPGEPMIEGKDAILEKTKMEMQEDKGGSIRFEILDIFAAGDYATEVGKWVYTDSTGTESSGKFMALFEKRDGKYVCIRDIWNSDSDDDDDDAEDALEDVDMEDIDAGEDMGS